MDGEAKCNCQRCGQLIAFPFDLHNTETTCPHCGKTTTLAVPQVRALPREQYLTKPLIETPTRADYILAILMPLIGFIIGIILLAKNKVGSGIGCIVVSVVCGIFYLIMFALAGS